MTMSLWDELLPKLTNISDDFSKNIKNTLELGLAAIDEFSKDTLSGRRLLDRDLNQLVAINEDEVEIRTTPKLATAQINSTEDVSKQTTAKCTDRNDDVSSNENNSQESEKASSKKRNKDELCNGTPEQDKRHKRNASVRAQGIISKQVNVNLTAKLRRPADTEENKENRSENVAEIVQVKQEKMSLPQEDETLAEMTTMPTDKIKEEPPADTEVMPPPPMPVTSKARRTNRKKTEPEPPSQPAETAEDLGRGRRSTRTRKQADTVPQPTRASERSTRASSRLNSQTQDEEMPPPPLPDTRPKRTRAKKQQTQQEESALDAEEKTQEAVERSTRASSRLNSQTQDEEMPPPPLPDTRPKRTRAKKQQAQQEESGSDAEEKTQEAVVEPSEKPRPKRTRRGRKVSSTKPEAESKPQSPPQEQQRPEKNPLSSPVISAPAKKMKKSIEKIVTPEIPKEDENVPRKEKHLSTNSIKSEKVDMDTGVEVPEEQQAEELEQTRVLSRDTIDVVADNATGSNVPQTNQVDAIAKNVNMNETIVLSKGPAMNETVVLDKVGSDQMTNDSSLMTSDGTEEIEDTPPRSMIPVKQPTSAVKQRVEQFEKLANGTATTSSGTRLTRTKTRAMKKQSSDPDTVSPPDTTSKPTLSAATLAKLNALPVYKNSQLTASATKPRSNIVTSVKSFLPASATKPTAPSREEKERDKEDARKKKEALLEAKREDQRRRRENKMAAAAAARSAAARERAAQLEARAQGWQEKQDHVDQAKMEKLKEAERKRLALEKKAAETEERRRAEEAARLARLEEEQRRALQARKRMQEEAERIKREELKNEREIQLKKQQYLERLQRQKLLENVHTPMTTPGTPSKPMASVHMADGFQYLNSDSEGEDTKHTPPDWSRHKARIVRARLQERYPTSRIDKLFSVQRHTLDLTELFPAVDRRLLKRTSSAVWRTPPRLAQLDEE